MSANFMFPTCWFIVSGLIFASGDVPVGFAIAALASFWLRFEVCLAYRVQSGNTKPFQDESGDDQ